MQYTLYQTAFKQVLNATLNKFKTDIIIRYIHIYAHIYTILIKVDTSIQILNYISERNTN